MTRSMRSLIQLGLALFLSVTAGALVYQWLGAKGRAAAPRTTGAVPMAVAARDLPAGVKLVPDMIRLVPAQPDSVPGQYFSSAAALGGRVLVAAVGKDEPITNPRLAPESVTAGGVSAMVTPGKRAMSVKGNKVMGLAGFIRPGNMVDVLVTFAPEAGGKKSVTKVVLENVPVLATGTQLGTSEKEEATSQVDIYTVELSPEESEKLALVSTQGTLHFALRNAADTALVLTEGADVQTALGSYRAKPARARHAGGSVELIAGVERSMVKF